MNYYAGYKDSRSPQSPLTPAVTGIEYPNDELSTAVDSSYYAAPKHGNPLYTHPNVAGSTIDDVEPPANTQSLDQLWGSLRMQKERKMAKEKPKVQSLEERLFAEQHADRYRDGSDPQQPAVRVPVMEYPPEPSTPKPVPRRQKSISNFRESADGRAIVATFDLPDVAKQDIHISYQRNKLILTWETAEVTEWEEEDGVVLRDQVRKMYHRTLPLPEGTKFDEIHAQMTSKGLTLRFPNMRCQRVDGRSRSGDS